MNPVSAGLNQLDGLFRQLIFLSVGIAFMALVVMLVVAGIKFLTSGGEVKALQSATGTATWAILGILFLAIIWLVLLLLEQFTGIKLTQIDLKVLCLPTGSGSCP